MTSKEKKSWISKCGADEVSRPSIEFGVSILTGWFDTFNRWAQDLLSELGINWSAEV